MSFGNLNNRPERSVDPLGFGADENSLCGFSVFGDGQEEEASGKSVLAGKMQPSGRRSEDVPFIRGVGMEVGMLSSKTRIQAIRSFGEEDEFEDMLDVLHPSMPGPLGLPYSPMVAPLEHSKKQGSFDIERKEDASPGFQRAMDMLDLDASNLEVPFAMENATTVAGGYDADIFKKLESPPKTPQTHGQHSRTSANHSASSSSSSTSSGEFQMTMSGTPVLKAGKRQHWTPASIASGGRGSVRQKDSIDDLDEVIDFAVLADSPVIAKAVGTIVDKSTTDGQTTKENHGLNSVSSESPISSSKVEEVLPTTFDQPQPFSTSLTNGTDSREKLLTDGVIVDENRPANAESEMSISTESVAITAPSTGTSEEVVAMVKEEQPTEVVEEPEEVSSSSFSNRPVKRSISLVDEVQEVEAGEVVILERDSNSPVEKETPDTVESDNVSESAPPETKELEESESRVSSLVEACSKSNVGVSESLSEACQDQQQPVLSSTEAEETPKEDSLTITLEDLPEVSLTATVTITREDLPRVSLPATMTTTSGHEQREESEALLPSTISDQQSPLPSPRGSEKHLTTTSIVPDASRTEMSLGTSSESSSPKKEIALKSLSPNTNAALARKTKESEDDTKRSTNASQEELTLESLPSQKPSKKKEQPKATAMKMKSKSPLPSKSKSSSSNRGALKPVAAPKSNLDLTDEECHLLYNRLWATELRDRGWTYRRGNGLVDWLFVSPDGKFVLQSERELVDCLYYLDKEFIVSFIDELKATAAAVADVASEEEEEQEEVELPMKSSKRQKTAASSFSEDGEESSSEEEEIQKDFTIDWEALWNVCWPELKATKGWRYKRGSGLVDWVFTPPNGAEEFESSETAMTYIKEKDADLFKYCVSVLEEREEEKRHQQRSHNKRVLEVDASSAHKDVVKRHRMLNELVEQDDEVQTAEDDASDEQDEVEEPRLRLLEHTVTFDVLWKHLKTKGWTYRNGRGLATWIFCLPGVSKPCKPGQDHLVDTDQVFTYCTKHPHHLSGLELEDGTDASTVHFDLMEK